MEMRAAIDTDVCSELAIRALRDAWREKLDAAAAARPLSEVELLALTRESNLDELAPLYAAQAPPQGAGQ